MTKDSGKKTLASPKFIDRLLSSVFCLEPEVPDEEVPENVPEVCWERGISLSGYESFSRRDSVNIFCARILNTSDCQAMINIKDLCLVSVPKGL